LHSGGYPAGIDSGAGGAHGGAEDFGDFIEFFEGFGAAEASSAGDDDAGGVQSDAAGLLLVALDQLGLSHGGVEVDGYVYSFAVAGRVGRERVVGFGANGGDLGGTLGGDSGDGIAAVDGAVGDETFSGVVQLDFQAVLGEADVEASGQPGGEVSARGGAGDEDDGGVGGPADLGPGGKEEVEVGLLEELVGGGVDSVCAVGDAVLGGLVQGGAGEA